MLMAPTADRPKLHPITALDRSSMTEGLITNMVSLGMLQEGDGRAPLPEETSAHLHDDEVVVFCDFFVAGLRFPMYPVPVDILRLYGIFMHQLTPNSFVGSNLHFLLAKTCRLMRVAQMAKPNMAVITLSTVTSSLVR
jgi:hypothetical protein